MSDSFLSAFSKGLDLNMKMDTLQAQEQMRQLQMQEMALKLIDHQNKMALGQQFQDTPEYSPGQLEPSKIRPGAYSISESAVPVSTTRSPVMESFLQQFPKQLHPFVEAAAKTGNYEWAEKVPKIEGQKAFTLQPGAVHYMPDASSPGGLKQVQGPPKEKDNNEFQTFKLSMPKGDKESDAEWNARVSKSWDAMLTKRAIAGRSVFSAMPTPTPGIFFDRMSKKYFETNPDGSKRSLSSDEVKNLNLTYKEDIPTNDIKVMQQSVPSVKQLVNQSRENMKNMNLGPLASRWRELMSGKIGSADPEFRKLRVAISLLQTRLMKMHVGSRGGEYIMKHFQEVLDGAKDSPENLTAALNEIETYADEVGASQVTGKPTNANKVISPSSNNTPKVGEVRKGYRFKGGDPSKPDSWGKI